MDEIKILKLKNQGYCCSQIMVIMTLEIMDKQNDQLVDFARGLCLGSSIETGTCGILTAGISILSMYAEKGDDRLALMQDAYHTYFKEQTQNNQSIICKDSVICKDIAGDYYPSFNPDTCGHLLTRCYSQLMTILVENGFDPAE